MSRCQAGTHRPTNWAFQEHLGADLSASHTDLEILKSRIRAEIRKSRDQFIRDLRIESARRVGAELGKTPEGRELIKRAAFGAMSPDEQKAAEAFREGIRKRKRGGMILPWRHLGRTILGS